MNITPERFPQERRNDPKRQAEAAVFDTLANSQSAGHALYEWSAPGRPHQIDFPLWLEGIGRFAIEGQGRRLLHAPGERPVVPARPRRGP